MRWLATSALFLVQGACQPSKDLVASSYGDDDPDNPPSIRNIGGNLAVTDPSLFFWQGTYYVFSTGFSNSISSGLDLRSSKDLQTFKLEDPVLSPNPAWVERELAKVTVLWSPYVLAWDGMIHLYYAASWFGASRACIGHATTPSMDKPFVDDGVPVFCSNINDAVVDPFVAIDPAVILDDAGDPWMIFGSGLDGINIIALDRQGGRVAPKRSPHVIAAREPGSDQAIQAASLYRWRDYYYLFASHDWPPNHILRVGRSDSVTGPYVDRAGNPMLTGGGTTVVDKDDFFHGPGSNMVFDDGKQRLNVYHAYNSTDDVVLRIAELVFDKDGWPVSAGP
jgi:arabinan endo-1,5-alpha-L-arabinosidase